MSSLEAIAFDIRLALRGLRRDWTYGLASIAMLALALALNATLFTVMDAVLFRGFRHVQRNDQLVFLQERDRLGRCCLSYADFEEWQAQTQSFQGMARIGGVSVALRDGQGRPMDLRATTVDANLFSLLGVPPALGRDFGPADAAAGAAPVVMLTHRFWHNRLAGRPDIVGSVVQIDGAPAEIVGVMPEGFEFPEAATDGLWIPIRTEAFARGLTVGGFTAAARLRDGVALPDARAELEALNRGLEQAYPETNAGLVPTAVDYAQFISGADARVIWGSLWAAACLVLLIACANVANLTVVRTIGRWRQFETCLALGAGRSRMVRQMLVESAIVAGAAGLPAWFLTRWSTRQWAAFAASPYQVVDYRVNAGTLSYLAVVTIAAAVLVSVAPVVRVLQLSRDGALKASTRGVTQGLRTRRLVTALVAGQMALAVMLLAGSGLLIRSFANIVGAETGVRHPETVLVGRLRLPSATYPTPQSRLSYLDRVQARLQTVPGIEQESLSGGLPVKFSGGLRQLELDDRPATPDDGRSAVFITAAPNYFDVVGARLIAGRDFTDGDRQTTTPVAIVNERFASLHWPGESPLGKRIRAIDREGAGAWRVIVGVVSNIMNADALRQQFKPLVYVPLRQEPPVRAAFFLTRTSVPAGQVAAAIRAAIQEEDADVRLDFFDTLDRLFAFDRDNMDAEHSELGKYSKVAPVFAVVALLLAATGLVSVIAHSVSQRTREIGVRMAIGAAARDISQLILREGMRPVAVGLGTGLAAALAANRILQSQLVGVSPYDPLVLIATPTVLVGVALAACLIPLRRALRIEAAVALRHE
jgi:putative ABC transport system permease protein